MDMKKILEDRIKQITDNINATKANIKDAERQLEYFFVQRQELELLLSQLPKPEENV